MTQKEIFRIAVIYVIDIVNFVGISNQALKFFSEEFVIELHKLLEIMPKRIF